MCPLPTATAALCTLFVGLAVPLTAQQGPCAEIISACTAAGFTQGGVSTGIGLHADCVIPIMQGTAQPTGAARPLPQVAPQVVAACKARRPAFGQGKAATPALATQPLSPSAPLPLATPASTPAQLQSGASSVTNRPVASLPALTASTPGTGSIAVEMETISGGKMSVGNATTVSFGAHEVTIQFAQGDEQVRPVQTCFAGQCTLSRVTITRMMHSSGGQPTPVIVYTLTNATVSHLARTPCAGPHSEQPCLGPFLAGFAYENIDVAYPSLPAH